MPLIRPACYLDTGDSSHAPQSPDTTRFLFVDNNQCCKLNVFLYIESCDSKGCLWVNIVKKGSGREREKMKIQKFFFSSKEKAILSSVSKLHSASRWNNILNMQSNLIPF